MKQLLLSYVFKPEVSKAAATERPFWGYSITWTEHQLAEQIRRHMTTDECRQLDIGVQKTMPFF